MDSGNPSTLSKELVLGTRELQAKSQGEVAVLCRTVEKLISEVRILQKGHKRNADKLNSLIAAHEMRKTWRTKRRRCMPQRSNDLAHDKMDDDDDEEEEKAAAAEVIQEDGHA